MTGRPGWQPPAETLEAVRETFRRPGTAAAALGYYRASMRPVFDDPAEQLDGMIAGMGDALADPALYLHGADDGCIGIELVRGMDGFFPAGLRTEIVPGAGHFVHHERPTS